MNDESIFTTGNREPEMLMPEAPIDVRYIGRIVRRHAGVLATAVAVGLAVATVYLYFSTPTYVSGAKLLIESDRGLGAGPYTDYSAAIDSAQVESQAEILRAAVIAGAVIRKLDLVSDPEFVPPRSSPTFSGAMLSTLERVIAPASVGKVEQAGDADQPARSPEEAFNLALASFNERITVRRVGQSNVIEADFAANSPDKATTILRETIDTYLSGAWREEAAPNAFRRFNEDVMRKSLALTNARVISAASHPLGKSSPRTSLILAFAVAAGLFVGFSIALWLEGRRPRSRLSIGTSMAADDLVDSTAPERGPSMVRRAPLTDIAS